MFRWCILALAALCSRSLERSGLVTRDIENAYLAFDPSRYHGVFAPASPDRIRVVPKTCAAAEKT